MLFSVFGEEYVVFCTFGKSRAGWLAMQGISRSLDHYAGDLAAQGIVSDNIEGWRKGKAIITTLKKGGLL